MWQRSSWHVYLTAYVWHGGNKRLALWLIKPAATGVSVITIRDLSNDVIMCNVVGVWLVAGLHKIDVACG